MNLRSLLFPVTLALLLCVFTTPSHAEEVIETWRNPFGHMRSASVNSADGSVWVASGGSVLHLAPDGTILTQTDGFVHANAVAVNQTDGSCWVDDHAGASANNASDLVHLAEDGTELLRIAGFWGPLSLSVNATDGSCWVGETFHDLIHLATDGAELWRGGSFEYPFVSVNPTDGSCWASLGWQDEYDTWREAVVHLAEDGTELLRLTDLGGPLTVNPTDDSCWVAASDEVVHLAEDGTELWGGENPDEPVSISVNPTDGSCWVAGLTEVVHLAENGTELWRGAGFDFELDGSISVNSTDGSCWLIHGGAVDGGYGLQLVHLSEDGVELWRRDADFYGPTAVSASLGDGSCWVADWPGGQTVRLAPDGTEVGRADVGAFLVSANSTDGSCWVGTGWDEVIHLAADGTELLRVGGLTYPNSLFVNPTDGSCWVTMHDFFASTGEVVHLAESGAVRLRFTAVDHPYSVSVNPADGSCWVADFSSGAEVVHLASDGTELWRGGPTHSAAVSVNPVDSSCWVAQYESDSAVVHLAEDGTELWRGVDFSTPTFVSVNPVDGSCWVGQLFNDLIHLAEDGAELWRGDGFGNPHSVSVNPVDGSCWMAQGHNGQVVRLEVVGYEGPHFLDIMPYHWAFQDIEACADAEIVGGYGDGLYCPARSVTRDQMAVFISRALAGATVPAGPAEPTFDDVPTDYWAYDHIEYAVAANIVGGYEDGTYQPRLLLDRGQMAVFIARAMAGDDENVPDPTGDPSFPDVPADFWSYRHIEYVAAEGVAGGYSDGLYHPEYLCSRDQMAVFITKAFGLTM